MFNKQLSEKVIMSENSFNVTGFKLDEMGGDGEADVRVAGTDNESYEITFFIEGFEARAALDMGDYPEPAVEAAKEEVENRGYEIGEDINEAE